MTGDETVKRATDAYLVGMISFETFERWVDRGVHAGQRELPDAIVYLPTRWAIRNAMLADTSTQHQRQG